VEPGLADFAVGVLVDLRRDGVELLLLAVVEHGHHRLRQVGEPRGGDVDDAGVGASSSDKGRSRVTPG
jgi:hypothetical protein